MDDKPDEKGINQWSRVDQFPEHLKKYALLSMILKFT
jgi:trimethylguanosine synthase